MPTMPEPEWLTKAIEDARREGRINRETGVRPPVEADTAAAKKPRKKRGKPEAEFQEAVVKLARLRGWVVAHFRAVKTVRPDGTFRVITPVGADGRGFPDLVLVRDRVIFAELKAKQSVRGQQKLWHERLRAAGAEFYVWRPKHWPQIEEALK